MLLQEDVLNEMDNGSYRAPSNEFQMRRVEFQAMSPRSFGQRLRQERRYRKYCNHLESKRAEDPYAEPEAVDGRRPMDDGEGESELALGNLDDHDYDMDELNRKSKRRRR